MPTMQEEMRKYFDQLKQREQVLFIHLAAAYLKRSRLGVGRPTRETYTRELLEAVKRVESGVFATLDEVLRDMKNGNSETNHCF